MAAGITNKIWTGEEIVTMGIDKLYKCGILPVVNFGEGVGHLKQGGRLSPQLILVTSSNILQLHKVQ